MTNVMEIMEHVLKLPRSDRGYLAQKLIDSLENEEDADLSDHQKATLDRRSLELKSGAVTGLSLDQLKEQVRSNLG